MEREAADAAAQAGEGGAAPDTEPAVAAVRAAFAERQLSLRQVRFGSAWSILLGVPCAKPIQGASVCCLISSGVHTPPMHMGGVHVHRHMQCYFLANIM